MFTNALADRNNSLQTINVNDGNISELSPTALGMVADFFKVRSEISRIQILCTLKFGPKNVTEIINQTGLGQANVSKHLKILTQGGMVKRTPQGVNVFYEICNRSFGKKFAIALPMLNFRELQTKNEQFDSFK